MINASNVKLGQSIQLIALASLVMMMITGCASNYYVTAYQLQQRENYIGAIDNYDLFIARTHDGAMRVKAINHRSLSYYQLGLEAMNRNNYRLAIRLFYLANTLAADSKIAESYIILGENAYNRGDIERVIELYDYVIDTYPELPAIANIIYRRLLIYHNHKQNIEKVWENYVLLVDVYNDFEHMLKAEPIIDNYMPILINNTVNLAYTEGYPSAIEELLHLFKYPHSYHDRIEQEIGSLFYLLAQQSIERNNFFQAYDQLQFAVYYSPVLQDRVNERLNQMVNDMINRGKDLMKQRKVAEAIVLFEQTFRIMPDNKGANEAIETAVELRDDINNAAELFSQALAYERNENYTEALRVYRQSYRLDSLQKTADRIFLMTNLIEIESNPVNFARTIITEYKNGIITDNINRIVNRLQGLDEEVSTSGWRIMLSTGTNRYEVRYDITSRIENYYLIWHVNLLNRNIVPLNKNSLEIMGEV